MGTRFAVWSQPRGHAGVRNHRVIAVARWSRDCLQCAGRRGGESIWVAPLDRSSSPRMLQPSANRERFTAGFIYYVKRTPGGSYVHRMHPDGSGDEQIWQEKILALATSPDGRYIAVTLPLGGRSEWKLEIVDWTRKRVQPVCNDALAYWSDDGRSFVVTTGAGKRNKNAPSYLVTLRTANGIPDLPANGFSDVSQFAGLKNAHTIAAGIIALGRNPDTYAYIKETVQRNLYRI